jgi:hypothetical protein
MVAVVERGGRVSIVTQLILILLGITIIYGLTIVQSILLWRFYKSWSWLIGAVTFFLLGARQIWGLLQLPSAIIQAQMQGTMITHLTGQQWIGVVWAYIIGAGFICFLDHQRRDLLKLGIKV